VLYTETSDLSYDQWQRSSTLHGDRTDRRTTDKVVLALRTRPRKANKKESPVSTDYFQSPITILGTEDFRDVQKLEALEP